MNWKIDGAVGLGWRRRADGPVAYWVADAKIVARGYQPKTVRLWPASNLPHPGEPTARDRALIRDACERLQDEMRAWKAGANDGMKDDPRATFDGTMRGLSRAYQTDPHSRFHKVRFKSQELYLCHLRAIELTVGKRSVANLAARDFLDWYESWATADGDGSYRVYRAHGRITMVRTLMAYGASLLGNEQCGRLSDILSKMDFERGRARQVTLTAEHVTAIRKRAHEAGRPEVALAEALKFELLLRPKDVLGEWLPLDYPGLSAITHRRMKWVNGLDWRNVTPDLILTHRLSKSVKGRDAVANPNSGKVRTWNLRLYPMVMEELVRISPEQRAGPIVKHKRTGLPFFGERTYPSLWRKLADEAGVPQHIQCRDSRAGGITETVEATDLETGRVAAGHSKIETTMIYDREADRRTADAAVKRAAKRAKNK